MRGPSLLVYCICETPLEPQPVDIPGVDGQPVFLIDDGGLSVVVSGFLQPAGSPAADVSSILDFEKVVAAFHRTRTVLPFRFGCVLDGEARAREALRERRAEYQALLLRLGGCVEMGIRLLLPLKGKEPSGGEAAPVPAARTSPGVNYLRARKALYTEEDRFASGEGDDPTVGRCRAAFAGVYEDSRSELPPIPGPGAFKGDRAAPGGKNGAETAVRMASLVFLVKRDREEAFREAFRVLSREGGMKILLSGPWPPYNFVDGEDVAK